MSTFHTMSDNVLLYQAIAPQAAGSGADAVTGTGKSGIGWEGLLAIVEMGAIVDSGNVSLTALLEQSASLSTGYTDITDATTGAIDVDGENEVYLIEVNLSEHSEYIRCSIDGGSSGGGLIAVTFAFFRGRLAVPSQENTVVQIGFAR